MFYSSKTTDVEAKKPYPFAVPAKGNLKGVSE